MFDLKLFLGFAPDAEFERLASRANPHLLSLFTGGGDYLSEISYKERRYLGKPVPSSLPVSQLESVELHMLSLLKKLAPDYPFSENPPVLVTCIHDAPCQRRRDEAAAR
ncbi:MAG: hypothetical protein JJU12_03740 [Chlamydiales bacterium]|nr:hypothetical protein [Chlamydiales bacterium]